VSRVEQKKYVAGDWIDTSQVWTFAQIAIVAGEGEVFQRVGSSMLSRDNVFHMVLQRTG